MHAFTIHSLVAPTTGPYKGKAGRVTACEVRDGVNHYNVTIVGVIELQGVTEAGLQGVTEAAVTLKHKKKA